MTKFYDVVMNDLMKPGETFKTRPGQTFKNSIIAKEGPDSTWYMWEDSDGKEVYAVKAVLSLEGEIIRAEPEVLTETQAFEKYDDYGGPLSVDFESGFRTGYGHGIPNGQIKEWKRLKPFVDAIENLKKVSGDGTGRFGEIMAYLFQESENLTPPWEPEK